MVEVVQGFATPNHTDWLKQSLSSQFHCSPIFFPFVYHLTPSKPVRQRGANAGGKSLKRENHKNRNPGNRR